MPNPPTNVACTESFDSYITLAWDKPIRPNGLIENYTIEVYSHPANVMVSDVTTATNSTMYNVEGLQPGRFSIRKDFWVTYSVAVSISPLACM